MPMAETIPIVIYM